MKNVICFLCLLATASHIFGRSDVSLFHPSLSTNADALRIALSKYITEEKEIRKAFGEVADLQSLPFYVDEWIPEDWPNQVISSTPSNVFATLGPWKIYFGRRPSETVIPAISPRLPQCIVYDKIVYVSEEILNCTRLVLDVRSEGHYDPVHIRIRGWYVQEFTAKDLKTKIVADAVRYTAAGGEWSQLKWVGGGEISARIVEPAFRGYVMRGISK